MINSLTEVLDVSGDERYITVIMELKITGAWVGESDAILMRRTEACIDNNSGDKITVMSMEIAEE